MLIEVLRQGKGEVYRILYCADWVCADTSRWMMSVMEIRLSCHRDPNATPMVLQRV